MDSRASLDTSEKRKISCPCWDLNSGLSSLYSSCYDDNAIPALPTCTKENDDDDDSMNYLGLVKTIQGLEH